MNNNNPSIKRTESITHTSSIKEMKNSDEEEQQQFLDPSNRRTPYKIVPSQFGDLVFPVWLILTLLLSVVSLLIHQSLGCWLMVGLAIVWSFVWICSGGFKVRGLSKPAGKSIVGFCGCFLILIECIAFGWFWTLAVQSDPSNAFSPCGKSSCTPQRNPNGWYDTRLPFCPFPDCRWADVNNKPIKTYDSSVTDESIPDLTSPCDLDNPNGCQMLLTQRRSDYPDWGYGLTEDWFEGITYGGTDGAALEMCPQVDTSAYNGDMVQGQGKHVCATCSWYIDKRFYQPIGRSPPGIGRCDELQVDNFMCFLCEDASGKQTLSERVATYWLVLIHIFATTFGLVVGRIFCM